MKLKKCFSILILFMVVFAGCGGGKQEVKTPTITTEQEKWDKLAETSKGHSPSPIKKEIAISEYKQQIEKGGLAELEKPLPTQKISLKMRNADIKSILRALARATNVNLLIKEDLKAVTSVDFVAVPWDEVFRSLLKSYGLTYVWEGNILRVVTMAELEEDLKAETIKGKQAAEAASAKAFKPLSTVVIPVDYADAKKLAENLVEFLTKDPVTKLVRGTVRVNEHSNALVIQALREDIEKMMPVIEKIDRPTPQILIRANIVETTKDVARNLGIQWGGIMKSNINNNGLWITPGGGTNVGPGNSSATTGSGGGTGIGNPLTAGSTGISSSGGYSPITGSTGLSGQGMGISFPIPTSAMQSAGGVASLGVMYGTLGGNILETQLQALETEGKANIIASPSLTTLDNEAAHTQSGEKVPYVSLQASGGTTTSTVNFVDAVLRLDITPHVIGGKKLKMIIKVRKDDVDTTQEVQGNPFITSKETETTLIVDDGETILLAGITTENKTVTENGVPGLMGIPALGWLFKNQLKSDTIDQILVFITPYILPPAEEAGNHKIENKP